MRLVTNTYEIRKIQSLTQFICFLNRPAGCMLQAGTIKAEPESEEKIVHIPRVETYFKNTLQYTKNK